MAKRIRRDGTRRILTAIASSDHAAADIVLAVITPDALIVEWLLKDTNSLSAKNAAPAVANA